MTSAVMEGYKLFWKSRQGDELKLCSTQTSISAWSFPLLWGEQQVNRDLRGWDQWGDQHGEH